MDSLITMNCTNIHICIICYIMTKGIIYNSEEQFGLSENRLCQPNMLRLFSLFVLSTIKINYGHSYNKELTAKVVVQSSLHTKLKVYYNANTDSFITISSTNIHNIISWQRRVKSSLFTSA